MRRILIFSGTTEGRQLTEFLDGRNAKVYVSTATEYGKECTGEHENAEIFSGRMDQKQMAEMMTEKQIDLVIDATHPFAQLVTGEIRKACESAGVQYLRCLREAAEETGKENQVIWQDSVEAAAEYLAGTKGQILITTGSKELAKYMRIPDYQERCYARVLSTGQAVLDSIACGFEGKHLIAMQGPFSKEMNVATIHQTGAKYFVTKESGKAGGFEEKVQAAKETGAVLVAVGRPKENGMSFTEVCEWLENYLEKALRAGDAHSHEGEECRKRPRSARECAEAHSFL